MKCHNRTTLNPISMCVGINRSKSPNKNINYYFLGEKSSKAVLLKLFTPVMDWPSFQGDSLPTAKNG